MYYLLLGASEVSKLLIFHTCLMYENVHIHQNILPINVTENVLLRLC